ncbi:unnamed protein product [Ilex paraguariensis]|uniref:Transmembrane protein n=1 Tax=Ilex paraguariensis TaxID=185542 RepID=A0ABC8S630_9AQUA
MNLVPVICVGCWYVDENHLVGVVMVARGGVTRFIVGLVLVEWLGFAVVFSEWFCWITGIIVIACGVA